MTDTSDRLTIRRPDDWHLHLRDGAMLKAVLPATAARFARAIVMPNLAPPVTTVEAAIAYRTRILDALPDGADFTPLMTCYLTDNTDPDELAEGFRAGVFFAVKLYPARATTNSEFGISDFAKVRRVLAEMENIGMPLLIHGEEAGEDIDIFDREAVFIERVLIPMVRDFPALRITLEHLTTAVGVDFVRDAGDRVAATITPHHLMLNRNHLLAGGIRPHLYCLPIVKREGDRLALRRAAVSGEAGFFLGTDSAPHPVADKETGCGCAGIFNAPTAIECYAQVFDEEGRLDRLEAFAALNGPAHYGIAPNDGTITLARESWTVPDALAVAGAVGGGVGGSVGGPAGRIGIFRGGETVDWRLVSD